MAFTPMLVSLRSKIRMRQSPAMATVSQALRDTSWICLGTATGGRSDAGPASKALDEDGPCCFVGECAAPRGTKDALEDGADALGEGTGRWSDGGASASPLLSSISIRRAPIVSAIGLVRGGRFELEPRSIGDLLTNY